MAAQGQWNFVCLLTKPFSRYCICQYCWSKPGLHSTALCVGMRPVLNAKVPAAHKAKKRRPRQGERKAKSASCQFFARTKIKQLKQKQTTS